jgi:drug/metabolite transporter (DMT)-like permease
MLLATLLWGATFVILRDTVSRVDPTTLVCLRFAIAALLFGVITVLGRRPVSRDVLAWGMVSGALGAGGYLFQAIGLTRISAGSSAFLTTAGTLAAGLFAWWFLGQRPAARLGAGLALAGVGSFLLAGRVDLSLGVGEAWTLGGALIYALQIVAVSRVAARVDPVVLAGVQAATVAVLLGPMAIQGIARWSLFAPADLARIGYLAIAGSMIAPWLQISAQRELPAGRVGLLFAMEPVFALLFAVTLGAESYAPRWWWGAGLILVAVALVEAPGAWRGAGTPRATA